jgi:hypothetical protein
VDTSALWNARHGGVVEQHEPGEQLVRPSAHQAYRRSEEGRNWINNGRWTGTGTLDVESIASFSHSSAIDDRAALRLVR